MKATNYPQCSTLRSLLSQFQWNFGFRFGFLFSWWSWLEIQIPSPAFKLYPHQNVFWVIGLQSEPDHMKVLVEVPQLICCFYNMEGAASTETAESIFAKRLAAPFILLHSPPPHRNNNLCIFRTWETRIASQLVKPNSTDVYTEYLYFVIRSILVTGTGVYRYLHVFCAHCVTLVHFEWEMTEPRFMYDNLLQSLCIRCKNIDL